MYLDELLAAQRRGERRGIPSICSAHPWVLRTALRQHPEVLLIESTCNQVNQYGGYTGMTPPDFLRYVRGLAAEENYPFENIILGGDHLGPNLWQDESAERAMQKGETLIRDYVRAGFVKIHLDCSMRLADDPPGPLEVEAAAGRTARLAGVAEECSRGELRYVIGTEVPVPGGAPRHEEAVGVTKVEDAGQTIQATREAFCRAALEAAWERVIAVVVQPGVEFGDDFVLPYRPAAAKDLSRFIEGQAMVYEAHSTDYQTRQALRHLVADHFAILKVGPALTFAFREAVVALAMMEKELIAPDQGSNIMQVLDDVMVKHPAYWKSYYRGSETEQALKRRYSLSDRVRYYWVRPEVQDAFLRLLKNLGEEPLPHSLLTQFVGKSKLNARQVIEGKIKAVLQDYWRACQVR